MSDQESVENSQKVAENEDKTNQALEAQKNLREAIQKLTQKTKQNLEEELKLNQTALQFETDKKKIKDLEVEQLRIKAQMADEAYKSQLAELQKAQEHLAEQRKINEQTGKNNDKLREAEQAVDKIINGKDGKGGIKQLKKGLDEANEALEKATKQSESFAERLQKASSNVGSLIGGIKNIAGQASKSINDMSEATTGFRAASTIALDFEAIKNTLKESVLEARGAVTSVANATGVAMGAQMRILSQGLGGFGIMNKELAESFNSLYLNMNKFSGLSINMQAELTATAAKMKNVGVDTKTYAQNLQTLNTSLGMSAKESNKVLESIVQSARQAGIAPQVAMADFSAGMKKFVVYGKEGIDVFMQMEKQSKALGIEMSKLNQITGDSFDTFEGAAQKAGGLNAILGGDFLNATEMVNATEAERVTLLRQAMEASGKSFESMDRYEKKAIAAQLGISDMEDAEKLFRGTSAELNSEMSKKVDNVSSLEKAQRSGADASRVQAAAERAVAEEQRKRFEGMSKLTSKFDEFLQKHSDWIGKITTIAGMIGPYAGIFNAIIGMMVTVGSMIKVAGAGAASGGSSVGRGMVAMARGFRAFTGPQIIVGLILVVAAIVAIGFAIKIASEGLAKLVQSFKGLTGEQVAGAVAALVIVMAGFIGIIVALGYVGIGAAPGILAVAVALGVMAGSIYLLNEHLGPLKPQVLELMKIFIQFAEKALGTIIDAMLKLYGMIKEIIIVALYQLRDIIIKIGDIIIEVVKALVEIFKTMGDVIKTAFYTIIHIFDKIIQLAGMDNITTKLLGIAGGITAIGLSLAFLAGGTAIGALGNLIGGGLQGLSNLFTGKDTKSGIEGVIESIGKLRDMINTLPDNTEIKIKGITQLMTVIQAPTPEKFEASTKLLERGKEYYQAQAQSKEVEKDALVNALKILFGTDNKDNTGSNKESGLAIKLYIDGDEMRNAVFKTSNI